MQRAFSQDSLTDGVRHDGNFVVAFFAGLIAASIGAFIWAWISLLVGQHVVYVAIGAGALIGLTIHFAGGGSSPLFGLLGAVLTLLAGLPSALLALSQASSSNQLDIYAVLTRSDLPQMLAAIVSHTTPLMYAVYAVGIIEAYLLSMRKAVAK